MDSRLPYRPPTQHLKNAAVSTAGDAERFVEIDGHRYSHIVDPRTGMGHEDRAAVTVVAPDGATADAMETAVYLLGPERGLKLVDETPGAAALYQRVTPERVKTFESSRFREVPKLKGKDATTPAVRSAGPDATSAVRRLPSPSPGVSRRVRKVSQSRTARRCYRVMPGTDPLPARPGEGRSGPLPDRPGSLLGIVCVHRGL